jgi:hypothetical protein
MICSQQAISKKQPSLCNCTNLIDEKLGIVLRKEVHPNPTGIPAELEALITISKFVRNLPGIPAASPFAP